jgi:hypothetical protein
VQFVQGLEADALFFTFPGLHCTVEELDDEEDEKNEGDGMAEEVETGEEEEESDLELAWKVLDCARVIYAKDAERTLAEVDVITTLADVSLEQGTLLQAKSFWFHLAGIVKGLICSNVVFKIDHWVLIEPNELIVYSA